MAGSKTTVRKVPGADLEKGLFCLFLLVEILTRGCNYHDRPRLFPEAISFFECVLKIMGCAPRGETNICVSPLKNHLLSIKLASLLV